MFINFKKFTKSKNVLNSKKFENEENFTNSKNNWQLKKSSRTKQMFTNSFFQIKKCSHIRKKFLNTKNVCEIIKLGTKMQKMLANSNNVHGELTKFENFQIFQFFQFKQDSET